MKIGLRIMMGFLACLSLFAFSNCSEKGSFDNPLSETSQTVSIETLGSGEFSFGADTFKYSLLKLKSATGEVSYAQWIPSPQAGPRPTVIVTQPYIGTTWSGEAVEDRWKHRTTDQYEDSEPGEGVTGPVDTTQRGKILYDAATADEVGLQSLGFLVNGLSVLQVFGRFYVGASISTTIAHYALAYDFLKLQGGRVDLNRVGAFGASWGGFGALYLAANHPPEISIQAGAVLFPVSDVASWVKYSTDTFAAKVTDPARRDLFTKTLEPYRRRIYKTTGGSPKDFLNGYDHFSHNFLRTQITGEFLLMHDQWDTLVPFEGSKALVTLTHPQFHGFWYPHQSWMSTSDPRQSLYNDTTVATLAHFQPGSGFSFGNALPFAYMFIARRLVGNENINILYNKDDLVPVFQFMKAWRVSDPSNDLSWFKASLIELCDSRISMLEYNGAAPLTKGHVFVARELNTLWGASFNLSTVTSSEVINYLQSKNL